MPRVVKKNSLLSFVCAALLLFSIGFMAFPSASLANEDIEFDFGTTIGTGLYLYAEADEQSEALWFLEEAGIPVIILETVYDDAWDEWYYVYIDEDQGGYIQAEYIQIITEEEYDSLILPAETGGKTVWIPTVSGIRYHRTSTCSNMINPKKVDISEAKRLGFTPCGKCRPGN